MMDRSLAAQLGHETVEIIEQGSYTNSHGQVIDIAPLTKACVSATKHFTAEDLDRIKQETLARPTEGHPTRFEVVNETTLAGISRLLDAGCQGIVALNFASAKHPGGGFLKGARAQEESLARSSALYASLASAWAFYDKHRASRSCLYSDEMILSPDCPIFRRDNGDLLEKPVLASFITSPAPNADAAAKYRPHELAEIPDVFRQRTEYVLALAAHFGYKTLILGAWGCGAFGNDPNVVAPIFADHLRNGTWKSRFERVVFSVYDWSPDQKILTPFKRAFD